MPHPAPAGLGAGGGAGERLGLMHPGCGTRALDLQLGVFDVAPLGDDQAKVASRPDDGFRGVLVAPRPGFVGRSSQPYRDRRRRGYVASDGERKLAGRHPEMADVPEPVCRWQMEVGGLRNIFTVGPVLHQPRADKAT